MFRLIDFTQYQIESGVITQEIKSKCINPHLYANIKDRSILATSIVKNHLENFACMRIATRVECANAYLYHVSWRPNSQNMFLCQMRRYYFINNSKMMRKENKKKREEKCHGLKTPFTAPKLSYF